MVVAGFREQIAWLEEKGELVRVPGEVDPRYQLAAIAKKMQSGPALYFEKVKGYDIPVVVGTDNSRARIAGALGTDNEGLLRHYISAIESPVEPRQVNTGPVKEVVRTSGFDLGRDLPVPTHYERDGGPYITTGLLVAELPEKGIRNVSMHRLQVVGPDEMGILMLPRHLKAMFSEREEAGRPLQIAVVIGTDIACRLASVTWGSKIPLGMDEFAIAGALRGRPVELVRCETVDVRVPADAEMVIEGEILPGVRRPEGPMAEFTGNYGEVWENPVIKVKAITHRKNPIYQDLLTFTPEHHLLLGLPYEPVVYALVKARMPNLKSVCVTPAGCGKFHVVISIKKTHQGDGKDTIIAGLYSIWDIKLVTVVDDDVDPFDPADVEWAVSTRFQADRDLVVIPGAKGNELDPSLPEPGITAKMGIDATKPLTNSRRFERIGIPGFEDVNLEDFIKLK